ncbi:MAG: hypothetical protein C4288_17110 [Leptolyngbya sp. ERB_1_1]
MIYSHNLIFLDVDLLATIAQNVATNLKRSAEPRYRISTAVEIETWDRTGVDFCCKFLQKSHGYLYSLAIHFFEV